MTHDTRTGAAGQLRRSIGGPVINDEDFAPIALRADACYDFRYAFLLIKGWNDDRHS